MQDLPRALRRMAAAIAFIAGYVDAIGFVGFGGMFVSFMSGNSTRIGAGAAAIEPRAVLLTAGVIAVFVVGVAAGQALGGTRDQQRQRRVLLLVAVALAAAAAFAMLAGPFPAVLAAAFAMGAINTVFASSPLPVGLTYMTGTLVKLGQALGQRRSDATSMRTWPYLFHWLALVSGAMVGAFAFAMLAFSSLWIAAVAVGLMAMRASFAER